MSSDDAPLIIADRYEIRRPIGQGGMGAVFEAVHVGTGRRLAVKTLLAKYVDDPVLVERFMREARATTAIGDPHVVEIVDIGKTPEGDVFMVMELLEGRELKRAMRQDAPLPVARACHIAYQIAAVMGRAHAKGIVHRDLKPANLFLVQRDRDADYVKVLDFGIAKLDRSLLGDAPDGATMTRTGQVIGTPSYMAPEQLQGAREVDARADVYALGVILYQMLAGDLPVKGESVPDIFLKVMTTEPAPVRSARPAVPAALEAIVHRALRREADARFTDCTEFAAALAPFAAQWVVGSAATATDVVMPVANAVGGPLSSPSGLSDPVVVGAVSSPDTAPHPNPVAPRWTASHATAAVVGGVALALALVVAALRPGSAPPATALPVAGAQQGGAVLRNAALDPAPVPRPPVPAVVGMPTADAAAVAAVDAAAAVAQPPRAREAAARPPRPRSRASASAPQGLILTNQ